MCKVAHNPPHTYGDCISACIATLIDRDDVPHTYDGVSAIKAWSDIRDYLKIQGKSLVLFQDDQPFESMAANNPGVPYILLCRTAHADHAVVCKNDVVIHDPSVIASEIVGAHSIGSYIVGVIGDLPVE